MARGAKVIKEYNANTMTKSQFFGKIRSSLRNAFRYWKPAQMALQLASRPSQSENKRLKKEFQCAKCKKWFKRSDVEIDHIIECGSLSCYEDIVPFLKRLAPEDIKAYQILCKEDHKLKTQANKKPKVEKVSNRRRNKK